MKEKIMEIIKNDPMVKEIYENNGGSFKNVVIPTINDTNDDKALNNLIIMLAYQCLIYDTLLDDIAKFGNKELIKKCHDDIHNILTIEE